MSSGLSWLRPSWVKLASIRGFPAVPGPHLGRSPGPHRIATSLQDDVKTTSSRSSGHLHYGLSPGMPIAHLSKSSVTAEYERKHPVLG